MVTPPKVLAVVPARGGSKSIPRKNLRPFAGHPLLAYSVAAALQASRVTRVIVSTDDEEIAEAGRRYGAEVPFLRPAHLAQDDTPDEPVFEHILRELENREGYRPEIVVHLRPTSPLRPPGLVDGAVDLLRGQPSADSVRGVVPSGQNPYKMWRIGADGALEPLLSDIPEGYNRPRQSLPPTFWQTGHIDAIRRETILDKHSMTGDVIWPLLIDSAYSADIDTRRDWDRAENLAASGLDIVRPGPAPRGLPATIRLVVLDFDGVLTDNRVWVDGEGRESVAAHRGDGWGLAELRRRGIAVVVLSTETNPVVAARCRKLGLPFRQGEADKAAALRQLLSEHGVAGAEAVYLGNDVNDVPCFPLVGCAFVVADAHPAARAAADRSLSQPGGAGAVRELCDVIVAHLEGDTHHAS